MRLQVLCMTLTGVSKRQTNGGVDVIGSCGGSILLPLIFVVVSCNGLHENVTSGVDRPGNTNEYVENSAQPCVFSVETFSALPPDSVICLEARNS